VYAIVCWCVQCVHYCCDVVYYSVVPLLPYLHCVLDIICYIIVIVWY
jgi:hypothetical protein